MWSSWDWQNRPGSSLSGRRRWLGETREELRQEKYFIAKNIDESWYISLLWDCLSNQRTYWRPWPSWSRCPRGRGCLRRWRGRCTAPRPTWRLPPAPADSRTRARRRNSETSNKLYRKLIKHKPNWSRGEMEPEIWDIEKISWFVLAWRPKIPRWGLTLVCQLTRHKTHFWLDLKLHHDMGHVWHGMGKSSQSHMWISLYDLFPFF